MADLRSTRGRLKSPAAQNWLRPSLLDRLTDHEPLRLREPAEAQGVDDAQLRQLVRRDLAWLLNTTHLGAGLDLSEFPEVARSVLNYGVPDLTGRTLSSVDSALLERQIAQGFMHYESRMVRDTIQVRVSSAPNGVGKPTLFVEVVAVLRTEPLPTGLRVHAEVDIESGRVVVGDETFEKEES